MQYIPFLLIPFLEASPVGNPASPRLIQEGFFLSSDLPVSLRINYEGDFVGDGRMKQILQGSGRVDTFQQYTNSGSVILSILNRIDLFGVFGSSRVYTDWRYNISQTVVRMQLETFFDHAWGLGLRALFFEENCISLSFGARYDFCSYEPSWMMTNATPVETLGDLDAAYLKWQEWQVDFALSYEIGFFTPYIGVKYSDAQARLGRFPITISSSGEGSDSFQNRNPVGIVIGCSISNGSRFMLNLEGRLIDEDAATISGDLRF